MDLPLPLSPTMPTTVPLRNIEADAAQNLGRTPVGGIADLQPADAEESGLRHRGCLSLGSMASRRASPSKVKPRVANISDRPAVMASQGDWSR